MSSVKRKSHTKGPGKHGHLKGGQTPREYSIWAAMIQRCYNPNCLEYCYYGGRGIRVCRRWLEALAYVNFLEDMGPQPFPRPEPAGALVVTASRQRDRTPLNRLRDVEQLRNGVRDGLDFHRRSAAASGCFRVPQSASGGTLQPAGSSRGRPGP